MSDAVGQLTVVLLTCLNVHFLSLITCLREPTDFDSEILTGKTRRSQLRSMLRDMTSGRRYPWPYTKSNVRAEMTPDTRRVEKVPGAYLSYSSQS